MSDDETVSDQEIQTLNPLAIIGFDGKIPHGFKLHPNEKHLLFPLGNKVSILDIETNRQEFLSGHTNAVTAIDVSPSGNLIASGQVCHPGFRSYVIVWDWNNRKENVRHALHRVKVESICFTSAEDFLISLGDRDDNAIVVWDIQKW